MQLRCLGPTATLVPAVGQGTMGIGGYFAAERSSDAESVRRLRLGVDLGLTLIDTAEVYGNGHSEELVGAAVRGIRDRVFIATKFSPENSTFEAVFRSAEASLCRLQTEWIDLYQAHWPNPRVPIEETVRAVERLVESGKVRYFGVSNFSVGEIRRLLAVRARVPLVSVQEEYSLIDRTPEQRILPFCREQELSLIAYSPLGRGRLGAGASKLSALSALAEKYGLTVAQLILRWLLRDARVLVIPKAFSVAHLRENAAAGNGEIAAEDAQAISDLFPMDIRHIRADLIEVADASDRKVYKTLQEAIENRLSLVPSPAELAEQIRAGDTLRPIKVRASGSESGVPYQLIEGRVRYWAWVIAHGGQVPIPALVEAGDQE